VAEGVRARTAPGTATLLTAAGAAVLLLGAWVGEAAVAAAVVIVQVGVAATWHALVRAPGERTGSLIGLAAGLAATVVAFTASPARAQDVGDLALVAVAGLFAAFGQRLFNPSQGKDPLAALLATAALAVIEVLAACWLPVWSGPAGPWVLATGAVGAALAVMLIAVLGTTTPAVAGALALGGLAGLVLGLLGPDALAATDAAAVRLGVVGAGAALAAVCGAQVRRLAGRSARTAPATVAALPLALAAPATYALARILLG
jgi:hypothetical protein